MTQAVRIIGGGRAGGAMAVALAEVGWQVRPILGRAAPPGEVAAAAADVDLVLIATPDAVVADMAAAVEPSATAAVAHLAGALGLDAVAPHSGRRPCTRWGRCRMPPSEPGACWRVRGSRSRATGSFAK